MTNRNQPLAALLSVLAGLGAWAPAPSWALSSDRDQPMKIEADQVKIDDQHEVSVYQGKVVVVQGSMRITADRLTVYSRQRGLQRLVAVGNPATYRQRPEGKDQDVHARARHMDYDAGRNIVILTRDAVLRQGRNTFSSNRITYDLRHDRVDAGRKTGGGRVEIIIQPPSGKATDKP